jgi:beta-galactosidase
VQFNQRLVTAELADLDAEISVRNDTGAAANAQVVVSIRDATGTMVVTTQSLVEVAAKRSTVLSLPLRVEKPHRWHGTRDPYLYDAVVQVRVGEAVIDEVHRTIGLRSMQIDPEKGFLLNGEPYDLHGVAMHQDRLGKGWLVSSEERREDLALLQELGVTFVRLVHYQHDQEVYDLMDRAGIVVWTELPVLMQVGRYPIFLESAKSQLTELIRQNAHHPSIVCWGLFNEIGNIEEDRVVIRELMALAKKLDPTRPTAGASYAADAAKVNFITDVISFNKYFGWYLPNINAFGPWADQFHKIYPQSAVGVTEYGAGGSLTRHDESPQEPVLGLVKVHSRSESYHALFHETVWPQLSTRKFLWCKATWAMFDYTADETTSGDAPGYNDMGLVSGDRSVRKDAFYYYKAQWSAQPVLHITERRFTQRQSSIQVKVYANVDHIRVRVNGVELPPVAGAGGVYRWPNVQLKSGANVVEASGMSTSGPVQDRVTWNVPKAQ